jgi:NDP-sugar pyrophosphorylase family protein
MFIESNAENPLSLVVLAAGAGSRYGGLKQIDPVGPNGELLIDYSIYDALRAGFGKVVFVINRRIDNSFREVIGKRLEKQIETSYVYQEVDSLPADLNVRGNRTKPWGTAHATWVAREVVDTPFAVINADDFYGRGSYALMFEYLTQVQTKREVNEFCMAGFRLDRTVSEYGHVSRAICEVDHNGYLKDINERTWIEQFNDSIQYSEDRGLTWVELPVDSVVSMNLWGFAPSVFNELENGFRAFMDQGMLGVDEAEYYLPLAVKDLVSHNKARVRVLSTEENWFGVTYQQDKNKVKLEIGNLILRGEYPQALWKDR